MPACLTRQQAEGVVKALQALLKAQSLYPAGHGAVQRARESLDRVLNDALPSSEATLVGVADGYLVVGGAAFIDGNAQAEDLAQRLQARQIEAIRLEPGVAASELSRFVDWLRSSDPSPWHGTLVAVTSLDRSGEQWRKGLRLHREAVEALREADRDLREGRIPDPSRGRECVAAFSELLDENPSVLGGLLLLKDYDHYTFHHSVNVSLLSLGIGRQLGLGTEELSHLGLGGLFHDIGKTRTPVHVIRKPGRLSSNEFAIIRSHPVHGREILEQIGGMAESTVRVVYEHHVRLDGTGYPSRAGETPLHPMTALVTTADVYDAMTTHRPYSPPMSLPAAVEAMARSKGTHFVPEVFDAFLALMGTVPVGSLLRLRTGEVAVVTRLGPDGKAQRVLVVAGPDGRDLANAERFQRDIGPEDVAGWVGSFSRQLDLFEAVGPRR